MLQFFVRRPSNRNARPGSRRVRLQLEPLENLLVLSAVSPVPPPDSGQTTGSGSVEVFATGRNITPVAGVAFTGFIASFYSTDSSAVPEQFNANIDWGDGTTSPGLIGVDAGTHFDVSGSHVFSAGTFTVTIRIQDSVDNVGATVTTTALVQDAPPEPPNLHGVGKTLFASPAAPVTGVVAFFCDPNLVGTANQFSATINWGDGQTSTGTLDTLASGAFNVVGTNTYVQQGLYDIEVTIQDLRDNSTLKTTGSVQVTPLVPTQPPDALRQVAGYFSHSAEHYRDFLSSAYMHYLGRMADDAGLNNGVDSIMHGATDEQLEASFLASPEYVANHGGSADAWIDGMYHDLLGRDADAQGKQFWVNQVAQGRMTNAAIALVFTASSEREALRVIDDYEALLGRTPSQQEVMSCVTHFRYGATNEDLLAAFIGSPEYFNNAQGGHADDATWINTAYEQSLHRPPTNADIDYWLPVLKNSEHRPPVV